jgi:hypothetical protein
MTDYNVPFRTALTYFSVRFDPATFHLADFCAALGLDPEEAERFGTECTLELGRNERFDLDMNVMLRRTLEPLFGKEEALCLLRERYGLTYVLERVVLLPSTEEAPRQKLSLDEDIVAFLYRTGTRDELDYFTK